MEHAANGQQEPVQCPKSAQQDLGEKKSGEGHVTRIQEIKWHCFNFSFRDEKDLVIH